MTLDGILRIATFNVRSGWAWDRCNSWPLRRRATLRTLRDLDADIVGLQEAHGFQLRWLARGLGDYEVIGHGRNGGSRGEHVAVLVHRRSLRPIESRTRWFGDDPDRPGTRLSGALFPRIATIAVVEHSTGVRLQVINTHLDERSDERRRRSLVQLADWLEGAVPQVLLGDFNATPDDPIFAVLAERRLRQALPVQAGGTVHRFTGRRDGRRLDHIFVSDGVEVVDARIVHSEPGERLPSDHWPAVADVKLVDYPPPGPPPGG